MATALRHEPTANTDRFANVLCHECGRLFGQHHVFDGDLWLEPHYGERESGFYRHRKRMPRRVMNYSRSSNPEDADWDAPVTRIPRDHLPVRVACRHCGTINRMETMPI